MPLTPGIRLGSYEIVALIGAGGMGEVYRARDTKLNRDVALKVLPDTFAQDADRLARFKREAQVLASLNHPNIAAIYGLEESAQAVAIVMELVEGDTLSQRLESGPLPVNEGLPIARQVAEALQAAHEKAVVHRDLKPANIAFTLSGQVKVLDFGLAKALDETPAGAGMTNSPTLSLAATRAGVILGTAAYMSPEQAKGRDADRRSDVWAFGCVFYEMLTGKRAFGGEDISDTIVAVLRDEPNWNALPVDLPASIRMLLERSLAKDRAQRIPDISTALFLMNEPAWPAGSAPADARMIAPSHPRTSAPWRVLPWVGTVAAAVVAATLLVLLAPWRQLPPARPMRFAIAPSAAQPLITTIADRQLAISPDGTMLVYVGGAGTGLLGGQLVVRGMDRLDAEPLRGITGARAPFFSPDGKWIGFSQGTAELRKVSVTGGPSVPICRTVGGSRGASWGPDDTIVFATVDPATGLFSVPTAGAEPKMLTKPDLANGELDHLFPSMLPGGAAVLFTITTTRGIDAAQVAVLDLKTGQRKVLIRGGNSAEYVDPGYLIYAAAGTLRAVRFDPVRLEVTGEPVPVIDQVGTVQSGAAEYSVSRTGTLLYVPGRVNGQGAPRSLVWTNRQGREEPINAPVRAYFALRLAPDGSRLALDIRDQDNDIWTWDLARHNLMRLTFAAASEIFPVWTPDGMRIIFSSNRAGVQNVFWHAADGTGADERLTTSPNAQFPTSFTADGHRLVITEILGTTGNDLSVPEGVNFEVSPAAKGEAQAGRKPTPIVQTAGSEDNGEVSPDGRWLAYDSSESGQNQVYVRPFPDVNSGRWQISTSGGSHPLWAHSGRELFYIDLNGAVMTVPVQLVPSFRPGSPAKLFDGRYFSAVQQRSYDISLDDQRFVMIRDAPPDQGANPTMPSMVVVINWLEELKARLPATK